MFDGTLYEGICFGGPLNGETVTSRFPKGFLLIDKPANHVWFYEWDADANIFNVREELPSYVLLEGPMNRYRAAEENNYDVIAIPWVGSDDN